MHQVPLIILRFLTPVVRKECNTRFRFGPLGEEQILPRLEHVCKEEKVKISKLSDLSWRDFTQIDIDEEGKQSLMRLAQGDMRKVLNILQVKTNLFLA